MSRKKQSKNRKKEKKNEGVKLLPISIILFIILAMLAILIILNKGKIAGYSLVRIQTSVDSDGNSSQSTEVKQEDKMEILVEKKYLSSKAKEKEELKILVNRRRNRYI